MAATIYALLVGINDYAPEIGKLAGCVNDVDHVHDFLTTSFDKTTLAVEVLKDADATRDNIIRQFRTHLTRATADDVAMFLYCGHGARWTAAREFKEFFPEGKDEGLVCADSRLQGGAFPYDLADKELAVLLAEVAKNNPHLAVILDCCHSGSGTRDVDSFTHLKARQTHEVLSERPLDSYIDGYYMRLRQNGQPLSVPRSRHVLMAACDRTEKAMERADRSGVFTSTLLDSLTSTGTDVSYTDLFVRCRMLIRREVRHQTPQFEAFERFNAQSGFLGRTARAADKRFRLFVDRGNWTLDAGVLHGVSTEEGASLAVYPESVPDQQVGTAKTTTVGLEKSTVQLDFAGDPKAVYRGEITSFGIPPMPVLFTGSPATQAILQSALDADRSVGMALTDAAESAAYVIVEEPGRWLLKHRELDLLVQGVLVDQQSQDAAATAMARTLKTVARWERGLALHNTRTKLDTSLVEFIYAEALPDGGDHVYASGEEIVLDYVKRGTEWKEIRGRFKVRNRTQQPLYLVLAYFSQDYGIYNDLYNDRVAPGDDYVSIWGESADHYFYIDDPAKNESIEEFKLFVSTEPVDAFSLRQDPLALGVIVPPGTRAIGQIKPMRTMVQENEWFALHLRLKVVRQLDRVGATDAAVAQGSIVVKAHPSVTAQISMTAAQPVSRSVNDGGDFYRAFERQGLELLNFATTRGDGQSVLELSDIQNADTLRDNPLDIELMIPLQENEAILPVVFDGQHAALGGDPYKDENGHTRISIDHIPEIPDNRRSLGGSLKLYFFKTYLKQGNVNQLRWIDYKADGSFEYHKSAVAERVAAARNVLLLIHGIIGDTEGMVRGIRGCGVDSRFDLVLTYDYENLSTPIADTSRTLKAQLAAAGLHEGDGKRVTVLAHSMGGLVSRWFIEREGGKAVVDHLVMCGTPNNGSPLGRIDAARKVLNVLMTVALNYLPGAVPFAGTVVMLLNRSKKLTPTLEQMNPSSEFITTLNSSEDPGIPYTVLAGDVDEYRDPGDPLFARLLTKAGQGFVAGALFAQQAHDIAVGVQSILSVPGTRRVSVSRTNVACHHLNYFVSEPGQTALRAVQWGTVVEA